MVLINDFWIEDYMSLVRGKMPRVTGKIVVLLKVQTVQNYMNRKKKNQQKRIRVFYLPPRCWLGFDNTV